MARTNKFLHYLQETSTILPIEFIAELGD